MTRLFAEHFKVPTVVTWYVAVRGKKPPSWSNAGDNRGLVSCEMDERDVPTRKLAVQMLITPPTKEEILQERVTPNAYCTQCIHFTHSQDYSDGGALQHVHKHCAARHHLSEVTHQGLIMIQALNSFTSVWCSRRSR